MSAPTLHQITSSLTSTGLPYPSTAFLTTHLTPLITATPPRPLPALIATAKHRLLSSNIVSSSNNTAANPPPLDASKNNSFPANITDVHKKEVKLGQDICVQVLDVEDLGKSKWEQIEALEAERKGEMTKGREVIRVVQDVDGPATQTSSANSANANTTATANKSYGPFKLLLQDMRGQTVYGFELKRVDKVGTPAMGMSIGCKVMLKRGTKVARGMVLLEPKLTIVLGGKIEGLDKAWKDGREARLREEVKDANQNGVGAG